ncbi:hypothetical protein MLD38_021614 [Melastoma candidum]|uniref:Uncharacterized protein n=1 Tax=Melastoma candidum TaxID=119954 RepID=A0ACB9QPR7_9MYRT|nr:hypothetical protein MLD38_021614 [Melastoma candidum]
MARDLQVGGPLGKTCQGSLCHTLMFERPFRCSVDDCSASYRRKEHLTRHSIRHEGKSFACPFGNFKLVSVEAFCCQCMKYLSSANCLEVHFQIAHRELVRVLVNFECTIGRCTWSFSSKSNLLQHVKASYDEARPYVCGFPDCGKAFACKHVRDNHEKSEELCSKSNCNSRQRNTTLDLIAIHFPA